MNKQLVAISEIVTLRGGVAVPVAALRLALDLEGRGITLRVEEDALIIRPRQLLTEADIALLKQHRNDLKRIAAYEAPEI